MVIIFRPASLVHSCLLLFVWAWGIVNSTAQDSGVTVCWWNVQNFGVTDRFIDNRPVPAAMKPDSEIASMVAIVKRINPDVLIVGELLQDPEEKFLKLLVETFKNGGLPFLHVTTAIGEDARIQMVILSKLPFVETNHFTEDSYPITLTSKSTKEQVATRRRVGRGILNAVIEPSPGFRLRLMAAHLKSKRPAPEVVVKGDKEPGEDYIRRNEALILRGHMTRAMQAQPEMPLLVLGDLNDSIRSPALKTILGPKDATHRVRDLWLKDYHGDWWTHFYPPDFHYARIDYAIANDPAFARYLPKESYVYRNGERDPVELNHYQASDHRPIVVRLSATPVRDVGTDTKN